MLDLINDQIGRILLGVAIAAAAANVALNPPMQVPEELQDASLPDKPGHVEFDRAGLIAASAEVFFAAPATLASPDDRFVFVPEVKVVEFVPVDLDIPPAGMLPPPRLLPEMGPSLEGSHGMPRAGEEFGLITVEQPAQGGPRR